jgi:hypothetical protein
MADSPPDNAPDPDGWARFEHAIDRALHSPPKHREAKPKGESSPAKRDSNKKRA